MATNTPKALDDMFHDMLKDVYYAEKQILKALPKMAKAAKSPELKKAFETHREQTEGHVERLSDVFEAIGKAPLAARPVMPFWASSRKARPSWRTMPTALRSTPVSSPRRRLSSITRSPATCART